MRAEWELYSVRRSGISIMLAALMLGAMAGQAMAEPCPYNWYWMYPEPADSSTAISGPGYDWRGASVSAYATASNADHGIGLEEVRAQDDFIVEGPAPGTTLTIGAQIHVQGWIWTVAQSWSYGSTYASLGVVGGPVVELWLNAGLDYDPTIDESRPLAIPVVAGQAFRLRLEARARAQEATARVSARLSFPDLPPGVTVRSCQGLVFGEGVVATRQATWGALKARFR